MSSFLICLTQEELDHTYLAVNQATIGNGNQSAVQVFEDVLEKLSYYASDGTKMAASMMRITGR